MWCVACVLLCPDALRFGPSRFTYLFRVTCRSGAGASVPCIYAKYAIEETALLGRGKAYFGLNILVLVYGAVSHGVKPQSPSIFACMCCMRVCVYV